jgi:hypothetical protein
MINNPPAEHPTRQSSLADVTDEDIDTALDRLDTLDDIAASHIRGDIEQSQASFHLTKLRTMLVKIRFPGVIKKRVAK